MKKQTITFTFQRSTKNTHVYQEDGAPEEHKVGSLYIKKTATEATPPPVIKVTIEAQA